MKNIKTIRLNVKLDYQQLGPFTIINTVEKCLNWLICVIPQKLELANTITIILIVLLHSTVRLEDRNSSLLHVMQVLDILGMWEETVI